MILIVEDEPAISGFMAALLSTHQYRVQVAGTGERALSLASSHSPDLLLLDMGLPDMDGLEVIGKLRTWSQRPILVVSARDEERAKVLALDAGADDYMTKPFGSSELLARIRVALRHSARAEMGDDGAKGSVTFSGLTIDYSRRGAAVDGREIHLTRNEFRILQVLAARRGQVLTYEHIAERVWGRAVPYDRQILRVNVANIRRKLEADPSHPRYILTQSGAGYYLNDH